MTYALIASLLLGLVMTLGDFIWAALHLPHRVAYGLIHGAVMCLCLGLAVGIRARGARAAAMAGAGVGVRGAAAVYARARGLRAGLRGVVVGVLAAAAFYALAPALRWVAMFPAWMLLWILFALLQHRLDATERPGAALIRGMTAALLSGAAFYSISGIWTRHAQWSIGLQLAAWSFAFVPGFLALFWRRTPRREGPRDSTSEAAPQTVEAPPR